MVSGDDEALLIVRDITEHKHMEERIRFLAYYDNLTHLPNRLLFKEQLESALARARAQRQLLAVMIMDLDRFKLINDTLDPSYDGFADTTDAEYDVVRRLVRPFEK